MATYNRDNGFNESDLLHYGYDHIDLGIDILKNSCYPGYYASAGYLLQLGSEIVLKAWILFLHNEFKDIHNLTCLCKEISALNEILDNYDIEILKLLDKFYTLRYPKPGDTCEIGQDDLPKIEHLLSKFWQNMPPELHRFYNELTYNKKGGQVVMYRKSGD